MVPHEWKSADECLHLHVGFWCRSNWIDMRAVFGVVLRAINGMSAWLITWKFILEWTMRNVFFSNQRTNEFEEEKKMIPPIHFVINEFKFFRICRKSKTRIPHKKGS